ncbi:MAG: hypothetical protein RL670_1099, partial [Actinomycetota bacterium]
MNTKSFKVAAIVAATATFFAGLVAAAPANAAVVQPTLTAQQTGAAIIAVTSPLRASSTSTDVEFQFSNNANFSSLLTVATSPGPVYFKAQVAAANDTAVIASSNGAAVTSTEITLVSAGSGNIYVRARETSGGPVTTNGTDVSGWTSSAWSTGVAITRPIAPAKPKISATSATDLKVT